MGSREQLALAGPSRTSEPKFVGDSGNHVQSPLAIMLRPILEALVVPRNHAQTEKLMPGRAMQDKVGVGVRLGLHGSGPPHPELKSY